MVLGQRGRRAPQGKLASNPSITDLSYTTWADMRCGNLCMDSAMLLPIATGIHHKTVDRQVHRELMFFIIYPSIICWLWTSKFHLSLKSQVIFNFFIF